ncbi:universal stress protein [Halorubrum gandharaense]
MPDSVLVPMDGSSKAEDALTYALDTYDADVTALFVADLGMNASSLEGVPGAAISDLEAAARDQAEPVFETAEELADEHDATLDTAFETGTPANTIVDYAEEGGFDEIVIGTHGRTGASRVLLGSVAETVARRSPVPVTIVK